MKPIPFSRPTLAGTEIEYIRAAAESGLASGGEFTARCERWLEERTGSSMARLSHSGTGALEAAMILAGLGPGDEVIMPSFAYPTMATAVLRQGAAPVFVDIEAETLNIDPARVAAAVGPRTRAIVAVHYGGVGCEMETLGEIAAGGDLVLIEDAAHCLLANRDGRALGAIGDLGTYSFHHTKNLTCGEGGALLVNRAELRARAEQVWEKGTDRARFERGEVDRYAWVEVGSSFTASELSAAFLWGQLEIAEEVTERRRRIWDRYHEAFAELEVEEHVRRPVVPPDCRHNGHLYYLLLPSRSDRDAFIAALRAAGVACAFHYVPLHDAPAGQTYGRVEGPIEQTEALSVRLARLPLWADIDEGSLEHVIETSRAAIRRTAGSRA
jgi:dTDP-4-amino-4,6-dideoxygalactose transaminase